MDQTTKHRGQQLLLINVLEVLSTVGAVLLEFKERTAAAVLINELEVLPTVSAVLPDS